MTNGRQTPRTVRSWVFLVVVAMVAAVALVAAVRHSLRDSAAGPVAAASRVATAGTALTLEGRPWWPIGVNAYQLGTDWDINAGCGAEVDLDGYFAALPSHSLTRVPFLSTLAVNKTTGTLDFSALDDVVDSAARHRQLLVVVLTGNDGACEDEQVKQHPWYAGGWRTEVRPGTPMSFADWIDTAVGRWQDTPAIIGWAAVGEPEPSRCGSPDCAWQQRSCPADAATVLRAFFDDTGARIRSLDPDTTVWNGLVGGGQCGSAGADYETVGRSPGVDVLEYHDYGPRGIPLPGDPDNGLQRRIDQAHRIGKPLVVAEIGEKAGTCLTLADREADLAASIAGQRAAGTAGALFWAFVPDPRPNLCSYDIGPGDPLLRLVGDEAGT